MFKQILLLGCCFAFGLGCSAMAGGSRLGWAESTLPSGTTANEAQANEAQANQDKLPAPAEANEKAPEKFRVKVETTKGDFVLEVNRDWSPNGADRFYNLVKIGYFQDIAVFRAIEGFMFQFGIHGDPKVNEVWSEAKIKDDPNAGQSNGFGTITFAKTGEKNSRSVQFFINLGFNNRLDAMGFTPFGKVVEGEDVLKKINTEYGENSPEVQGRFQDEGNEFIKKKYPKVDMIKRISLLDN
jgi:peptidyl-prolyl cis-trans isomerase A (cyclophilin A)